MNATEARSELSAMNEKEIQHIPEEEMEYAEQNKIYIFSVSPYTHQVQHPLVGRLTIPACKPGEKYSEPAILRGLIMNGVCVEMKTVEMRRESGRQFAVDVLGLGPYKRKENSLLRQGVFIAAGDTFDADDLVSIKVATARNGQPVTLSLPRWVKSGKLATKPTENELSKAREFLATNDRALIAEADGYANDGPQAIVNITKMHREALGRLGQLREWAKPIESLNDCPGCGDKVRPGVVVHSCGAVFDWDKAIALGIKKASDRPKKNEPAA